MYLARTPFPQARHYILRQSVKGDHLYQARDLYVFEQDPACFIHYPGGSSFYLDEALVETVRQRAEGFRYEELEDILWPFVDPAIQRSLRGFRHRSRAGKGTSRIGPQEETVVNKYIHRIDKQRLNYLRPGKLDQTRLGQVPAKLYRPLLYKSRDELEQYFIWLEQDLRPSELALYCYSFFNLRRFFYEIHAGKMPQALDQDKLDRLFVQELCSLNADTCFWGETTSRADLHPYLIRYAIMFFDSSFGPSTYLEDILLDFIARRRFHRAPPRKQSMPKEEMASIFQLSQHELRKLSTKELTRLYRKLAKRHHPDQGGDHERFIQLNQAYVQLMKSKKVS